MRHILTDLRGNPIYSYAQRRFRRIRQGNASTLTFLVQNRSWEDVLRRVRRFPNEVLHRDDSTGSTPLHLACRLDPPVAVIRALKATSRVKNHSGATPLHIAASHRCSAESLTVLIEEASKQPPDVEDSMSKGSVSPTADLSRMGRAPIHYACMSYRGLDLKAFQVLFEASLREGVVVTSPDKGFGLDDFAEDDLLDDDIYQADDSDVGTDVQVNVLGLRDATGETPLSLLFRRYRERVKVVIRTVDRLHRQHQGNANKAALAAAMTVHADLGGLWERAGWIVARLSEERMKREGQVEHAEQMGQKGCQSPAELAVGREAASWAKERLCVSPADLILSKNIRTRTANISSDEEVTTGTTGSSTPNPRRRFRILHASVGLAGYGCPPEMVRLAISLHPHQVREMDEDGNLPIHIAATASAFFTDTEETSPSDMMAAAAVVASDGADDMSVMSDAMSFFSSATVSQTTNPFDKIIKLLLQYYPEAARIPHGQTGKLPLIAAMESGVRTWEDGIRSLVQAYPPALHSKRLVHNGLYATILALVADGCQESKRVTLDERFRPTSRTIRFRQRCHARTTLFELLHTKPDWME